MQWLKSFWPAPLGIDRGERLRVVVGAMVGVWLAASLGRWGMGQGVAGPWLVASLGASAVLVFGMPSSPLAQPWPVVGGSALSALVGTACAAVIPDTALAGALAVGLSVALMVPLRCLHPPGGAMALYMVLTASEGARMPGWSVVLNLFVLLAVAVVYNGLTGRRYPHPQRRESGARNARPGEFAASDVDAALAHFNQVLDISRADLEGLLHLAGRAAFQRTLGEIRCAQIMSTPPLSVAAQTSLRDAWAMMRREQIKALPIVDSAERVVGIVTVADFMRLANLDVHEGLGQRLKTLVLGRGGQPTTVGEIMSSPVQVALMDQHAMELVPLFSQGGHHHVPIVDEVGRLVGVITQSDLVRTLAQALPVPVNVGGPSAVAGSVAAPMASKAGHRQKG